MLVSVNRIFYGSDEYYGDSGYSGAEATGAKRGLRDSVPNNVRPDLKSHPAIPFQLGRVKPGLHSVQVGSVSDCQKAFGYAKVVYRV